MLGRVIAQRLKPHGLLGAKMAAYERNGVREYIVWQILEDRIDWFQLEEGKFRLIAPVEGHVLESLAFAGPLLDVDAMVAGDLAAAAAPMEGPWRT